MKTRGQTDANPDTGTAGDCAAAPSDACPDEGCLAAGAVQPDLTWLLHRAAQNMRTALDHAAQEHGLAAARDWLVLTALHDGPPQPQLALAHSLGLDKTTMTSLLDRLELGGLITRRTDSHDRRARIPVLTEDGSRVQAAVTRARDRVEACRLSAFSEGEQDLLRELLVRLAEGSPAAPGSCM
jgi:DNA-binding MarR family transcriptional regulator